MDALVGASLMTLASLGALYTSSKVSVSQRYQGMQSQAISQMRNMLQDGTALSGWCLGTAPAPISIQPQDATVAAVAVAVTATCTPQTAVTLNGKAIATPPQQVTLTATSVTLFGGDGVLTVGDINGL